MKALKILFADDDLKYSMLLKRFLEKEGYEVTYARCTVLDACTHQTYTGKDGKAEP